MPFGLGFACMWLVACLLSVEGFGQAPPIPDATADPLPEGALMRMGSLRLAHGAWLTSVRFSADDRWVGAADSEGVVRLWDVATGKLVWEKPKRTGRTLAFSPDGKTLAIGGYYNQEITLWDLQKDEEIRQLPQNARSLAFSQDGAALAAAGQDKIARLWDPQTGKLLQEFKGHEGELFAVALSPDGRWLASGGGHPGSSRHNEIRLWETATGQQAAQLEDDNERLKSLPDSIYSLAFSADGKTLGAAGPYVVRLWDVERRKLMHRLTEGSYDVAFSPLGKRLAIPGDFGIYELESGKQSVKLAGDVGVYGRVAYSHDGKLLASGNMEGRVQLWSAQTGKEIVLRWGHERGVRGVAFSPDGTLAASVSRQDATVRIWGTASGAQLRKIPVAWRGPDVWWSEEGADVLFAPYGRELLTWTYDSTVRYWRPDTLESRSLQLGKTSATAMAFSSDGIHAAVVEYSGGSSIKIGVYELDGGSLVASLAPLGAESGADPWVSALAFSPDGKTLAVGVLKSSLQETPAPSVQLWDLPRKELKRQLRPALAPPGKLCFSPDGTLLASSAVRGSPLQLWRVSDGAEQGSFPVEADAHGRDPAPLAFSPDGKRLAAADANREISVWELATGDKMQTFRGHQKAVTSIAFSPDGATLLSGSEDTTMVLWDVSGASPDAAQLTPEQLAAAWEALAALDADVAAEAGKTLSRAPGQAVELFHARLTAGEALDLDELPQRIADLSGDDAMARSRAAARLKSFGAAASPALFAALAQKPPLAVRRRIEEVMRSIGESPTPPEALRRTRAIQLLEQIGGEDAEEILKRLADTRPPTTSSLDAKAAFERLQQRLQAPKVRLAPP